MIRYVKKSSPKKEYKLKWVLLYHLITVQINLRHFPEKVLLSVISFEHKEGTKTFNYVTFVKYCHFDIDSNTKMVWVGRHCIRGFVYYPFYQIFVSTNVTLGTFDVKVIKILSNMSKISISVCLCLSLSLPFSLFFSRSRALSLSPLPTLSLSCWFYTWIYIHKYGLTE